jgi:hypothetical protein
MPGGFAFDELHAMDYLAYAYRQTGRDGEARKILEDASRAGTADFSVGCYCEGERRCHRSLMRELLVQRVRVLSTSP